jgi:hypothetical protein
MRRRGFSAYDFATGKMVKISVSDDGECSAPIETGPFRVTCLSIAQARGRQIPETMCSACEKRLMSVSSGEA